MIATGRHQNLWHPGSAAVLSLGVAQEVIYYWNRRVIADPVTAAEATNQSRRFISNHQLERVDVFFCGVDGNRRQAKSFDVGNRGSRGEHSSELLGAMIARRILMHRQRKRGPGKTVCRGAFGAGLPQPVKTSKKSWVSDLGHCEKAYRCCIDVRHQRSPENGSISGVPTALRTCSVAQHLRSQLNSSSDLFAPAAC